MRLLIFFWLTARRLRPSFWQVKPAAACRSFGPCRRWISTAPRSAGHQLSSQPPAPPGAPQTRSWRAVTRPKSWNRWLAGTGELRVGGGEGLGVCTVYENTLPNPARQLPKPPGYWPRWRGETATVRWDSPPGGLGRWPVWRRACTRADAITGALLVLRDGRRT